MDKRIQNLNRARAGHRLGQPLLWFDTVGSTNDMMKGKAQAGAPEGFTILADTQTQGHGRRGKEWLSLEGKGVYMSVLLRPPLSASEAALINMFSVVAVAQALEKIGVKHVRVKWPNDVLVRNQKIAGILVEPRVSRQIMDFIVVGIGINVRHRKDDLQLMGDGAATSCRLEGNRIDCDQVFIHVLQELESCYDLIRRNQKDRILEAWNHRQGNP